MDLMNGEMPRHWIENLDVNTPMNHFDFVGYLLEHEIVDDDTLIHLMNFEVYHSHRHVQQIDLAGTWAQNGVDGGQILFIIPVFRQLDLHFRLSMADVRRTIVIRAPVNDTMPFILHEMKGRCPEIREMNVDDLQVWRNDDLVNHDLRRYLHEVIDYEENKPFYSFHVMIQVRGGGGGVKRKAVAFSDMREQPNDPPNIKSVFNIQAFVSKAWLKSLSDEEAEAYNKELKNVKGMPHQIECTLNHIKEYAELKVGLKNQV